MCLAFMSVFDNYSLCCSVYLIVAQHDIIEMFIFMNRKHNDTSMNISFLIDY